MVDLEQLLPALSGAGVEFIIVGGVGILGEIAGGGIYETLISKAGKCPSSGSNARVLSAATRD